MQTRSTSVAGQNRDEAIIHTLTVKVRVLSLLQIARAWWSQTDDPPTQARRRLQEICAMGLLEEDNINVHPLLPLEHPLIHWKPGNPDPDFAAVGYQCQTRWTQPPRTQTVFVATELAARQRGGFGGPLTRREQATHDLHVGELYLRLLDQDPVLANGWASEDIRKEAGLELFEKLPDGLILDPRGVPRMAIEFAGKYPPARVADFHRHCKLRTLPYQLW